MFTLCHCLDRNLLLRIRFALFTTPVSYANPGSVPDRYRYIKSKWLFLLLVKQNVSGKVFPPKKNYPVKCSHGIILHNKKRKYGNEMECKSLETMRGRVPWFLEFFIVKCLHRRKAGNLFKNGKTLAALARTEMNRLAYRFHPLGGTPGHS